MFSIFKRKKEEPASAPEFEFEKEFKGLTLGEHLNEYLPPEVYITASYQHGTTIRIHVDGHTVYSGMDSGGIFVDYWLGWLLDSHKSIIASVLLAADLSYKEEQEASLKGKQEYLSKILQNISG